MYRSQFDRFEGRGAGAGVGGGAGVGAGTDGEGFAVPFPGFGFVLAFPLPLGEPVDVDPPKGSLESGLSFLLLPNASLEPGKLLESGFAVGAPGDGAVGGVGETSMVCPERPLQETAKPRTRANA